MKKFLVILMVLAMASVLFVGCTTPPTPTPDPDPDPTPTPVVVVSATPVLTAVATSAGVAIFDVLGTGTLYMNTAEAGSLILLQGTAPAESVVKVYFDDVAIATVAETGVTGLWNMYVAKSSLGADGVKVLTVKCTEVGLAESVASNAVTFTLDTVDPSFTIAATAAAGASGATDASGIVVATSGTMPIQPALITAGTTGTAVAGVWTIYCRSDSTTGTNSTNVDVTTPAGVKTSYLITNTTIAYELVTGFDTTFVAGFAAGDGCKVTVTAAGTIAAIISRATITFDEDVSAAGAAAGTYTTVGDPANYKTATDTGYWSSITVGAAGATYTITAYGFTDLAGNVGGTSTSLVSASCTVGAASATLLQP